MTESFIGVGSNVGDRRAFVRRAVAELESVYETKVVSTSSLYETSPVGGPPQRSFVNLVAKISTELPPRDLLRVLKEIEVKLGREPGGMRWGPRVADLDILTYGDAVVAEEGLEIPHPRMTERRFVLVPLLEIDPLATDPQGRLYSEFVEDSRGDVFLLGLF